jgi:hypothetical protein
MTPARPTMSPPSRAWVFFYPAAILVAIGVVLLSFGPAPFARPGDPVRGQASATGLALAPAALAEAMPDANHVMYVVRGSGGGATAVRFAVTPAGAQANPQANPEANAQSGAASEGVVLAFVPETNAALSGKAVTVAITLRPILNTPAQALAVRLLGEPQAAWTVAPIPPPEITPAMTPPGQAAAPTPAQAPDQPPPPDDSPRTLTLSLPATASVRGLAMRVIADQGGLNHGVEITAIMLTPAP